MLTAVTLLIALLGCTTTTTIGVAVCTVALTAAEPATALPGETVVLSTHPVTTAFDTVVHLDDQAIPVDSVDRTGCEQCDTCRDTYGCLDCGDCDSCDALCEQTCLETITVTLPGDAVPGSRTVQVFNAYGSSSPLPLEVGKSGTDTGDTGGEGSDSGG